MSKRIAVVVRERQGEALRMAIGLILMDDIIEVYVLDKVVEETEQNALNVETLGELDMKAYTNVAENTSMECLPLEEIAEKLLHYDHVLLY